MLADCIYFYLQHSTDISFQYSTFSTYKQRNLGKVLVLTLPDGYIMHVSDVVAADNRALDMTLLEHALATLEAAQWFEAGDVVVADSGFGGAILPTGVELVTPSTIGSQSQLETNQANSNRIISQVRFAVENVHRSIKEFKLLHNTIDMKCFDNLHHLILFAAALSNHWRKHPSHSQ